MEAIEAGSIPFSLADRFAPVQKMYASPFETAPNPNTTMKSWYVNVAMSGNSLRLIKIIKMKLEKIAEIRNTPCSSFLTVLL